MTAPKKPNATTVEALKEAESGGGLKGKAALDAIADIVLRYRPAPKQARKRKKVSKSNDR